jgi:hypothetical protein
MRSSLGGTIAALLLAAGCGSGASKGTYTLNLTGFDFHISQTVYLKVKLDGGTLGAASGVVSGQATLTLNVPDVLDTGVTYNADFFADVDGNGVYTPPSPPTGVPPMQQFIDHSWRRTVVGNKSGFTDNFKHNSDWTDISPF